MYLFPMQHNYTCIAMHIKMKAYNRDSVHRAYYTTKCKNSKVLTRHPDLVSLDFYAIPVFHILEYLHLLVSN